MTSGVPVIYRSGGDNTAFNFDWFDYAAGAGYKRFYAAGAKLTGGDTYFLTTQSNIDSDQLVCYKNADTMDLDFDITFNNPVTIAAADCVVNCTNTNAATGAAETSQITINIYHVRGSTETSLGTAITDARASGGAATENYRRTLKFALTSKAFAIGDKLRVNIIYDGSAAGQHYLYFDPGSRKTYTETTTGATITSDFTVDIPFKIDL